jgi:hypothetical protein
MTYKMIIRATCGLAILWGPRIVYAQAGGSSQSNVPVIASGQMPTATPSENALPENVLEGVISAGALFDDHAVLGIASQRSDITYSVSPSLSFTQAFPRFTWGLSYGPGMAISQHRLYQDQLTHSFGGHFSWRVSRHGTFSAEQGFSLSTNPFIGFGQPGFAINPGPTVSPNQTIYLPNLRSRSIFSHAMYSYQFGERSMLGFGGNFNSLHDDSTPSNGSTIPLIYSQTAGWEAYISHQTSARNLFGFQYGGQVFKFSQSNARTTTHSFLVFDQINFTPRASLTFYGGPEYSLIANQVQLNLGFLAITIPIKTNEWTAAGGVIYSWTGRRAAVTFNYSRGVSNGGGLVGAVELNSGSANMSWKLAPRWSLNGSISGADDQLLAVQNGSNEARTYSASLGLGPQISRNISVQFYFERLNQTGSLSGFASGNHDIAGASLAYTFRKPLGR